MLKEIIEQLKTVCSENLIQVTNTWAEEPSVKESIWESSENEIEKGLDGWMLKIAKADKLLALRIGIAAAKYAYNHALGYEEQAKEEFGIGFHEAMDGEPTGVQIERIVQWLDKPTDENFQKVKLSIDHTKQMHSWDDDMRPWEDVMWMWILEVGGLLAWGVCGDENGDVYQTDFILWPYHACIARSVICSLKTIARPEREVEVDAITLLNAILESLEKYQNDEMAN